MAATRFLTRRTMPALLQKGLFAMIREFSVLVSSSAVSVDNNLAADPSSSNLAADPSRSSCIIIGKYQNVVMSDDNFESLAIHVAKFPLVSKIRPARLITIDPSKTLECNDECRHLLWSGLLQSIFAQKRGISLAHAFEEKNVGVIQDMGILAFRKLVSTEASKHSADGHQEYAAFAKKILCKDYGPGALQELQEWDYFLQSLTKLTEDQLMYNSVFLQTDAMAALFFDIHRLLKHQFVCRQLRPTAVQILSDIHNIYSDTHASQTCSCDPFLMNFLGAHEPHMIAKALIGSVGMHFVRHPLGSAVVDIHRHAITHAIEENVVKTIKKVSPHVDAQLLTSYTREEIVGLLRYLFDRYPQVALDGFWDWNQWSELNMSQRLKVPSIFLSTSPTEFSPATQMVKDDKSD